MIPEKISGWPEWLPSKQIVENQFINRFALIYEKFGFLPLKTHSVERKETFLVKGEIEKQLYRLINPNVSESTEAELFLRFDLTVPLARYIVQNRNNLQFPFKRYQIQKVWRGERAQRARFREFYQCDIDIIGREALLLQADAEVIAVNFFALQALNEGDICLDFNMLNEITINISNRKIIFGVFDEFNLSQDDQNDILQNLDKIEKTVDGVKAVRMILEEKLASTDKEKTEVILDLLLDRKKPNEEKLGALNSLKLKSESYNTGVKELESVYKNLLSFGIDKSNLIIDLSIVRGLDYYSGTVFETFLKNHREIGSICSGGRYDNLIDRYIKDKMPGVGGSIGLSRLLYFLFEQKLISLKNFTFTDLLIAPFQSEFIDDYIQWMLYFVNRGLKAEIFYQDLSTKRIDKAMKKVASYCENKKIPYLLIYGKKEQESKSITLKNIISKRDYSFAFSRRDDALDTLDMIIKHITSLNPSKYREILNNRF